MELWVVLPDAFLQTLQKILGDVTIDVKKILLTLVTLQKFLLTLQSGNPSYGAPRGS
jgi:hypothetical protein